MTEASYQILNHSNEDYSSIIQRKLHSYKTIIVTTIVLLALSSLVIGVLGQCNQIGIGNVSVPMIIGGSFTLLILGCILCANKKKSRVQIDVTTPLFDATTPLLNSNDKTSRQETKASDQKSDVHQVNLIVTMLDTGNEVPLANDKTPKMAILDGETIDASKQIEELGTDNIGTSLRQFRDLSVATPDGDNDMDDSDVDDANPGSTTPKQENANQRNRKVTELGLYDGVYDPTKDRVATPKTTKSQKAFFDNNSSDDDIESLSDGDNSTPINKSIDHDKKDNKSNNFFVADMSDEDNTKWSECSEDEFDDLILLIPEDRFLLYINQSGKSRYVTEADETDELPKGKQNISLDGLRLIREDKENEDKAKKALEPLRSILNKTN